MRKNEAPRKLFSELKLDEKGQLCIVSSFCSCKAGRGKCIHLAGLFHQLNHWVMMGYTDIPESTTCTSREQQWHKPRGDKIEPEPLMEVVFAKPNPKRKKGPSTCSFSSFDGKTPPTSAEIEVMSQRLRAHNSDFPLAYLLQRANVDETMTQVHLGQVPVNSTLAHQLKTLNPMDDTITATTSGNTSMNYPDLPFIVYELPDDTLVQVVQETNITLPEAIELEKSTRGQNTDLWYDARRIRLTASQFASICKRKKAVSDLFLKSVYQGQALDNVKSIAYGKKNESKARVTYMKFMHSSGKTITHFSSGFVVNPGMPFLGCSPDGKIFDPSETPQFGLLEIKCPSSKKDKSLQDACSDKNFYGSIDKESGTFHLKESSNNYYQVQGQLFVCGVEWCDFVVYNGNEVWVERVKIDKAFCEAMVKKLLDFHNEHFYEYVRQRLSTPSAV